jgi:hypothetical protein
MLRIPEYAMIGAPDAADKKLGPSGIYVRQPPEGIVMPRVLFLFFETSHKYDPIPLFWTRISLLCCLPRFAQRFVFYVYKYACLVAMLSVFTGIAVFAVGIMFFFTWGVVEIWNDYTINEPPTIKRFNFMIDMFQAPPNVGIDFSNTIIDIFRPMIPVVNFMCEFVATILEVFIVEFMALIGVGGGESSIATFTTGIWEAFTDEMIEWFEFMFDGILFIGIKIGGWATFLFVGFVDAMVAFGEIMGDFFIEVGLIFADLGALFVDAMTFLFLEIYKLLVAAFDELIAFFDILFQGTVSAMQDLAQIIVDLALRLYPPIAHFFDDIFGLASDAAWSAIQPMFDCVTNLDVCFCAVFDWVCALNPF